MKEVLITGSEGFAGQHLWRELKNNEYHVSGTTLNTPESGLPENVYVCDIQKQADLFKLIFEIKPEAIFHLAAQPKPGLSFNIPQQTFEINTIGTLNLLESVREIPDYHPRIVMIGTSEEHGVVPSAKLPITEETPLDPINPYSISKVANWFLAKEYVRSFNFDIVYATPFNHTGPGQAPGFIAPDIALQIADIEKGLKEPVLLTGDLSSKRDISDVRDVVRAYRLLMEKGKTGDRYIISSGKSIPMSEIVSRLISLSKVTVEHKIDSSRFRPSDIPDLYGSHEKITQMTNWQPEIPLEKTLQDLLEWYRQK